MNLRHMTVSFALMLSAASGAATYNRIVVFGDSLSDTGNVLERTTAFRNRVTPRPAAPWYAEARWTNNSANSRAMGLTPSSADYNGVWHEHLARIKGIPAATNSLGGGVTGRNYAYGGAVTGDGLFGNDTVFQTVQLNLKNMGEQIREYRASPLAPNQLENTLFVFWGGGNDIRDAGRAWRPTREGITQAAERAVTNVQGHITTLLRDIHPTGGYGVLWLTVPPMGMIPDFARATDQTKSALNSASALFSDMQASAVRGFQRDYPALDIMRLDVYDLFQDLVAGRLDWRPLDAANNIVQANSFSTMGFDVKRNNKVPKRANPDDYVFWDQVHPTSRVHALIGEYAARVVPAPGLTGLAALGWSLLAIRRRRAA